MLNASDVRVKGSLLERFDAMRFPKLEGDLHGGSPSKDYDYSPLGAIPGSPNNINPKP